MTCNSITIILVLILVGSSLANPTGTASNDSLYVFEDSLGSWSLRETHEFTTIDGQELLVAIFSAHRGWEHKGLMMIFLRKPYRLILRKPTEMHDSSFRKPKLFEATPENDSRPRQFLYLVDQQLGTGTFKMEWIYFIDSAGVIAEVPLRPNPDMPKLKLNPGEQIYKPGRLVTRDDTLYHVHYIWNEGDGNCCPNAGRVTSTMKIYLDTETQNSYYRQFIDRVRVPYRHPIDEAKYNDH